MSGKRLTSSEWRAFAKEFVLRGNRVTDRTEAQEYELLMAQLPRYWGDEVAKAEGKKNAGGHWVKITNTPPEMRKTEITRILRKEMECEPCKVIRADNGFKVSLAEEDDRTQLLKKDGFKIDGRRISMTRARVKMSPEEIFAFVADRLQTAEEAEEMRRIRPDYYESGSGMHSLEAEPPRKEEKSATVTPPEREKVIPKPEPEKTPVQGKSSDRQTSPQREWGVQNLQQLPTGLVVDKTLSTLIGLVVDKTLSVLEKVAIFRAGVR